MQQGERVCVSFGHSRVCNQASGHAPYVEGFSRSHKVSLLIQILKHTFDALSLNLY